MKTIIIVHDDLGVTADLVIVNPAMPGAASFTAGSRLARPAVKVFAVLDDPADCQMESLQADLTEHKPTCLEEASRSGWVDTVAWSYHSYRTMRGPIRPESVVR